MVSTDLGSSVRRGLAWSFASTLVLRFASLALGIALARLLRPDQFGVYAVALTVQSILVTLADLGLSAQLIRTAHPEREAPTVATLSLIAGGALAGLMAVTAPLTARLLGEPEAAPVIALLSLSLVLAAAGVVPYARLQREIQQKRLFGISVVDFSVNTVVTLSLILVGIGPMALAIGRICAQASATGLQFVAAKVRPRFGFRSEIARPALSYSLPLALANLLSWLLLNVDNIIIATSLGATQLGFYVLAFNVSSWPMNAIGQAVRNVSFAAYSRLVGSHAKGARDRTLTPGAALAWVAGLLAGGLLALLASDLVRTLYGSRWIPSATVLAPLGLFGALRVVFDLFATYLMARGASRAVLIVQVLWIVGLVPVLLVSIDRYGLAGAGWAHVVVGVVVVLPAYLLALRNAGADIPNLLGALWQPLLAAIPAALVVGALTSRISGTIGSILIGAVAGSVVYLGLLSPWLMRLRRRMATPKVLVSA